jgi:hypothetical protein
VGAWPELGLGEPALDRPGTGEPAIVEMQHQGATLSNDVVLDCCLTACAWIGVISRTSVQAIAAATLMETPALNIRVFGKLSKRKPRRGLREP